MDRSYDESAVGIVRRWMPVLADNLSSVYIPQAVSPMRQISQFAKAQKQEFVPNSRHSLLRRYPTIRQYLVTG
jgi:hypothetical protein